MKCFRALSFDIFFLENISGQCYLVYDVRCVFLLSLFDNIRCLMVMLVSLGSEVKNVSDLTTLQAATFNRSYTYC